MTREFAEKIERYDNWAANAIEQADPIIQDQDKEHGDGYFGPLIVDRQTLHAGILQTARKDLGTDPLTQEALKLIGEIRLKKNQQ